MNPGFKSEVACPTMPNRFGPNDTPCPSNRCWEYNDTTKICSIVSSDCYQFKGGVENRLIVLQQFFTTIFYNNFYNNFLQQFFITIFYNNFLQQFFTTIFYNNFLEQFFTTIFYNIFLQQFFTTIFYNNFYNNFLQQFFSFFYNNFLHFLQQFFSTKCLFFLLQNFYFLFTPKILEQVFEKKWCKNTNWCERSKK